MRIISMLQSCLSIAFLCLVFSPLAAQSQPQPFYLRDGDTVVFYGDSITEQGYYTGVIDEYVQTRFPNMHVRFYSAGIGGDKVTGGFAGGIDERLQRDVFSHQPTVVTVMLGMNDGGYRAMTDQTLAAYSAGYEHILTTIRTRLPHARITLIGTSPYDESTRPAMFPGGYNAALQKLLAIDQMLARKYDAVFADFNAPVVDALRKGDAVNHLATEMLIPDRIHPGAPLHWIMAAALLKAWSAPAIVTSFAMDAHTLRLSNTENTTVTTLKSNETGLSWQQEDGALPLPLDDQIADIAFMLQISDVEQSLNQELLKISNLPAGIYRVLVDGSEVAEVTAQHLQAGCNVAAWKTPMRNQAQAAMWLVRDYEYTQLVHTRLLVRDHDQQLPSAPGDAELTKFQDLQQDLIHAAVQPQAHSFRLERIGN